MFKPDYPAHYWQNRQTWFSEIPEHIWDDWTWQLANRILSPKQITAFLPHINQETIKIVTRQYPFAITPYFLSLINPDDPNDPLLKQVLPATEEIIENPNLKLDPFNEKLKSPVDGVIKRYPDRVVITSIHECFTYCRYCTRKWLWNKPFKLNRELLDHIIAYLNSAVEIREVIISGGEPFLLPQDFFIKLIEEILSISHIEVLRIGTRAFSFMPQRITQELVNALSRLKPLWIMTHFNHPFEFTPAAYEAVDRCIRAGLVFCNQTVLLKGINDQLAIIKKLLYNLEAFRIKPYYLFQCDLVQGADHFRTPVTTGLEIMEKLRGHIGGVCIPTYVVDLPEGGKVPLLPVYLVNRGPDEITLKNYEGKLFTYPDEHGF